jgi:hypothetical protein
MSGPNRNRAHDRPIDALPTIMKEALIYLVVALSSLLVMSYAVHMLVGGLVTPETEYALIETTLLIGVGAIAYMAWDVIRRRRGRK